MSTFILIHGAGDVGWSWHLVAAELRSRGHEVLAPDLPGDDDELTLEDYADAVVQLAGERDEVIVVGHSFGAFTAPLVAERLSADVLVLLAGMVPSPGEAPEQWWENTGCAEAVAAQAAIDGGLTGSEDPFVGFYHDVPRPLAEEALSRERNHPSSAVMAESWPLPAWPDIPTHYILCTEDRFFPPALLRRVVRERLGIEPDEIAGGHCAPLSRPAEIAELLTGYADAAGRRRS